MKREIVLDAGHDEAWARRLRVSIADATVRHAELVAAEREARNIVLGLHAQLEGVLASISHRDAVALRWRYDPSGSYR